MDVLVMLEDRADHSPVLAHINSVPVALHGADRASRDVVTLYGSATAETLALALAAAVESRRPESVGSEQAIRHLGVWPDRGAIGDAAWRDSAGQLVTRDLEISNDQLNATAAQLLGECGQLIRRLVAGLSMPDWPEGARRAITLSLGPVAGLAVPVLAPLETMLERLREADALAYDIEGD
jgi:hypothetical protein